MSDGIKIDLSGAKEVSFEPLDKGRYHVNVFEVTRKETKGGPEAKLPKGTPMLNVQFVVDGEFHPDWGNRRVFRQYPIPPADYEKAEQLNNNLFTFYKAIGYTEAQIKKWKELPDNEDLAGRPCRIDVTVRRWVNPQDENDVRMQNDVRQVLPPGEDAPSSGLDDL